MIFFSILFETQIYDSGRHDRTLTHIGKNIINFQNNVILHLIACLSYISVKNIVYLNNYRFQPFTQLSVSYHTTRMFVSPRKQLSQIHPRKYTASNTQKLWMCDSSEWVRGNRNFSSILLEKLPSEDMQSARGYKQCLLL